MDDNVVGKFGRQMYELVTKAEVAVSRTTPPPGTRISNRDATDFKFVSFVEVSDALSHQFVRGHAVLPVIFDSSGKTLLA